VQEKSEYMSSERQLKLVSKEDSKGIKRTIMVYLDTFGSSSIDILVYCFSRSVVWVEWHEVKEDVMFKIADILKENDLEFAYPTMMLHQPEGRQDITE
jgi:MscS family membrane protein